MRVQILALVSTILLFTLGVSSPVSLADSSESSELFIEKRGFDKSSSLEQAYEELKSLVKELKSYVKNEKVDLSGYKEKKKGIDERVEELKKYVETKLFPTSWKAEFAYLQALSKIYDTASYYNGVFKEGVYDGSEIVEKVTTLNLRIYVLYSLQEDDPPVNMQSKLNTYEYESERLQAQGEQELPKTGQIRKVFDINIKNSNILLGNLKNNWANKKSTKN